MWWYLDHVFASNRGVGHPAYFMFTKYYWVSVFPCLKKRRDMEAESRKRRVVTDADLDPELESTLDSAE